MVPSIKVRSALVCDDIRIEQGGKIIAVGITNPVMEISPSEPGNFEMGVLPVHLLLTLAVFAAGEQEFTFRVRASTLRKGTIYRAKVEFIEAADNIPFPIGPFRVPIRPGECGFVLEHRVGERWKRIATWKFDRPVPSPARPA
jgi:hypothetical protein